MIVTNGVLAELAGRVTEVFQDICQTRASVRRPRSASADVAFIGDSFRRVVGALFQGVFVDFPAVHDGGETLLCNT